MRRLLGLLLLLVAAPAFGAIKYIAGDGPHGSGDCSSHGNEGSLSGALSSTKVGTCNVSSGDSIYLRADTVAHGTYADTNGFFIGVSAVSPAKLIVQTDPADQSYYGDPAHMATFDCNCGVGVDCRDTGSGLRTLNIGGDYVHVENVYFTSITTPNIREVNSGIGNAAPNGWPSVIAIVLKPSSSVYPVGIELVNYYGVNIGNFISTKNGASYPFLQYGSLIYNYGWGDTVANQSYGQGHYNQNGDATHLSPATDTIQDNIFWEQTPDYCPPGNTCSGVHNFPLGSMAINGYALQLYGSTSARLINFLIDGNFNRGRLIFGGGIGLVNWTVTNNFWMGQGGAFFGYNNNTCTNVTIQNNEISGFRANGVGTGDQDYTDVAFYSGCKPGVTMTNNHIVGLVSSTGNGFVTTDFPTNTYAGNVWPATNATSVRPNQWHAGRCNVYIFNYNDSASQNVDLTNCGLTNGQPYEIRSAINYFGSALSTGTWSSASPVISFPLGKASFSLAPMYGFTINPTPTPYPTPNYLDRVRTTNLISMAYIVQNTSNSVATATPTPTLTPTPTSTPTFTPTQTFTPSPTSAATKTPTLTNTPGNTPTKTPTFTPVPTATPVPTLPLTFNFKDCTLVAPVAATADATAKSGYHIATTVSGTTTPSSGGTFSCPFYIGTPGTWYLLTHHKSPASNADSWYFVIDEGTTDSAPVGGGSATHVYDQGLDCDCNDTCGDNQWGGGWFWGKWKDRTLNCFGVLNALSVDRSDTLGGPNGITLTVGVHTLKGYGREVGALLDQGVWTQTPNYNPDVPVGTLPPIRKIRVTCNSQSHFVFVPPGVGSISPCPWPKR